MRELRLYASEDETYKLVLELTTTGFPDTPKHEQSEEIQQYFKVRDDFTIDSDGFLCKQGQLVVPKALVKTYLQRLHSMHQGSGKMMARARTSLWWPFMARDISNHAKSCLPCETNKDSNQAELILTHEPSQYPFQHLHMDIGQEQGYYYLITTCQFSGYPNLHDTGKTCNTEQVIDATATLISHFGIPEIIYSDGGPQFLENGKFDKFCEEWGIRHILSSPYMPRSNGHAEAAVKQMKKLIKGNLTSNGRLDRRSFLAGMQMFRNTPRHPSGQSPNQLIFGRHIRDSLPVPREHLIPEFRFKTEERLYNHRQNKGSETARSGPRRELSLLKPKTPVRIQNAVSKKWDQTGFIISFGQNTREYIIRVGHKTMRRNRHFLKEIEVEAVQPPRQPAKAPLLPVTPQGSSFPVKPDWFKKPDNFYNNEEEETRNEGYNTTRKIRFSPIVETSEKFFPNKNPKHTDAKVQNGSRTQAETNQNTKTKTAHATITGRNEEEETAQFKMLAQRTTPGCPESNEEDDTAQFKMLAQRTTPGCSESNKERKATTIPTPRPQTGPQLPAPRYKSRMNASLTLSWPNNIVLKPRKFTSKPSPIHTPSKPPIKASKSALKQKPTWDSDSEWNPPVKLASQVMPARAKRSTAKQVNYDESWMDAEFSNWG